MPQTLEDQRFDQVYLASGLLDVTYEKFSSVYAKSKRKEGIIVSSAFTVCYGKGEKRKGRF